MFSLEVDGCKNFTVLSKVDRAKVACSRLSVGLGRAKKAGEQGKTHVARPQLPRAWNRLRPRKRSEERPVRYGPGNGLVPFPRSC